MYDWVISVEQGVDVLVGGEGRLWSTAHSPGSARVTELHTPSLSPVMALVREQSFAVYCEEVEELLVHWLWVLLF